MNETKKKKTIQELLLNIGRNYIDKYYIDQYNQKFVLLKFNDGHKEIHLIDSDNFKDFLARELYKCYNKGINDASLKTVLQIFKGMALQEKKTEFHNRISIDNNIIVYDLTNKDHQYVKITPEGYEIISNPQMMFHRFYEKEKEQVLPKKHNLKIGEYLDGLKGFIPVKNDDDWLLVKVWIVAGFIPNIPRPMLNFYGVPGSTKTTSQKMIKDLIDPSQVETSGLSSKDEELILTLFVNYYTAFENISYINSEQSDILCRVVTGSGHMKRKLYKDQDLIVTKMKRLISMDGINIVPRRGDLVDRSIFIEMEKPKLYLTEKKIWMKFNGRKALFLHDIFSILSKALEERPYISQIEYPRMADFCAWGEAISRAMGNKPNIFIHTYMNKTKKQSVESIEGKLIPSLIQKLMIDRAGTTWNEETSLLRISLKNLGIQTDADMRHFPGGIPQLSRRINRVHSNLEDAGIIVELYRNSRSNISMCKIEVTKEWEERNITLSKTNVLKVNNSKPKTP